MKFEYPKDATPLSVEDQEGLIPSHITTQNELNEWEQVNINEAKEWAFGHRHFELISLHFMQLLHRKMFNSTWKWAGKFRKCNTNIGVAPYQIQEQLKALCDDILYLEAEKIYAPDELAVRFHHRLVSIHPFPNGNGRHARLMADLLLVAQGQPRFSWGASLANGNSLTVEGEFRKRYILSLQQADQQNIQPLLEFVRL